MVATKGEEMASKNNKNRNPRPIEKPEEVVEEKVEETVVEEVSEPALNVFKVKVVNCEKLRIRKAPTTEEDNTIAIVNAGQRLTVKEHSADWLELVKGGFVMSKFVTRI